MKYHYIPQYNESEFNRIAKDADAVLLERWKRKMCTEIVQHRNAVFRELYDLQSKPHRYQEEDRRIEELQQEAKCLMLQIGDIARESKSEIRKQEPPRG